MSEDRPSIGFRTPSKEIEDALGRVREKLAQKKANWREWQQHLNDLAERTHQWVKQSWGKEDIQLSLGWILTELAYTNSIFIATLGIELAETHDRLAKIEKVLKEFRVELSK